MVGPTSGGAHLHQLAHAAGVDGLEGVPGQQALLEVAGHDPALDVVAAETERHLGQVVGAEGEEVGHLGDLVGPQRGPRRLDHGADREVELATLAAASISSSTHRRTRASSARATTRGIMISTIGFAALRLAGQGGLDQRLHLHAVQAGPQDPNRTPRVPSIGFCLVPLLAPRRAAPLRFLDRLAPSLRPDDLSERGQELVQRRVEQAHRDRQAVHRLEDLLEIGPLDRAQLEQRRCLRFGVWRPGSPAG